MISVLKEPENKELTFERLNTVSQLLNRLGARAQNVLVIRDGELLTQDRHLRDGDRVIVRGVRSSG